MDIPEVAQKALIRYLGDSTDEFISKIKIRLEKYIALWKLTQVTYMSTNTVNLLFSCESALYGPCVLKMCIPGPEVATEIHCLRAYDGRGYCKLWAHDLADDVLLLERVSPGGQLWEVTDHRKRALHMAQTIKDLPVPWDGHGEYPSYESWLLGIYKTISSMSGLDDVLFYLNKALEVYHELRTRYRRDCLLHGDLHQENLLLNAQGGYTVIDPKGVVDDPVMETARFLMNETPCPAEKIIEMAGIMSAIIKIPVTDMLRSMFVDAALGHSWSLEEHFPTQEAFDEKKREMLEICEFVYRLLV